ncbi:MAG: hypothetical protein ACOYI2_07380 [Bacillota bacterium]
MEVKKRNVKGLRALLTLPAVKSLAHEGDFINFYGGLGPFECGISTKKSDFFAGGWHWFVNATPESNEPINMKAPVQYQDGDTIEISLMIDRGDQNRIKFLVNGVLVHRSKMSYPGQKNARLVFASAQATSESERPLAPWGIFHSPVVATRMQYKNRLHIWRNINQKNSTCRNFRLPGPELVTSKDCPQPEVYSVSPFDQNTISAWLG